MYRTALYAAAALCAFWGRSASASESLGVEIGFRQHVAPSRSYDIVSENDALPTWHFAAGRSFMSGDLEIRAVYDVALTSAPLYRSGESALVAHEILTSGRWLFRRGHWLQPTLAGSAGMVAGHLSLRSPRASDEAAWGFGAMVAAFAGLDLPFTDPSDLRPGLRCSIQFAIGYAFVSPLSFAPARERQQNGVPLSGSSIGSISLSGPTGQLALAASFH